MSYADWVAGLQTQVFGRKCYLFHETDSTNSLALRLGHRGESEGSLVLAEYQTQGRGRRGRQWFSPPGASILASLILRPAPDSSSLAATAETWYTLLTALAVVQSIQQLTNLKAQVKWPNDVWIEDRKVCGILTECAQDQSGQLFCVIGFGINVNFPKEMVPLSVRRTATALNLLLGVDVSREALLQQLLLELETRVDAFRKHGVEPFMRELHTRSAVLNRRVQIRTPKTQIEGNVCGFDLDGCLLVRQDSCQVSRVHTGDLVLLD